MSIIANELQIFKSLIVSDNASNGGRMNPSSQVTSGVRNNILPNTTQAERDVGITRYRKIFCANRNSDDVELQYPYVHMISDTPAEDAVFFILGDFRDVQSDLDLTSDVDWRGGVGDLETALSETDTEIRVQFEDTDTLRIYPNTTEAPVGNRKLWIGEGATEEIVTWDSFTIESNVIVYSLSSGVVNDYTTAAKVAHIYSQDESIVPSSDDWIETSSSGTYDESTYPLVLDNLGTIDDEWTITFTSSTAFDVEGLYTGDVGSGSTSSSLAPINSDTSTPYFTLPSAGWGGTWASGDTITFSTKPAAIPFWVVQYVPENTPSFSNNEFTFRFGGESA
jgi:hypothetical protein